MSCDEIEIGKIYAFNSDGGLEGQPPFLVNITSTNPEIENYVIGKIIGSDPIATEMRSKIGNEITCSKNSLVPIKDILSRYKVETNQEKLEYLKIVLMQVVGNYNILKETFEL